MAQDAKLYLYEFLYRGRAPGSEQAPDYHVILAQDVTDAFGAASTAMSSAMTPAQARGMGFDLTKIVAAIDAGTMAENAALKSQVGDMQARIDAVETQLSDAQAKLDAAATAQPQAPADPTT